MLRGYVPRRFKHHSALGFEYLALEVSNPAPAGFSGAPVSCDGDPSTVVGIVAESYESSTLRHELSEVEEDGEIFRESVRAFVTYGVAVDLRHCADWLRERIDG